MKLRLIAMAVAGAALVAVAAPAVADHSTIHTSLQMQQYKAEALIHDATDVEDLLKLPAEANNERLLPCTSADQPVNFGNYWLRGEWEGLPLNAVIRRCDAPDPSIAGAVAVPRTALRANYVSYIYGDCDPADEQGSCAPPVEIQTWPFCERNLGVYRFDPEGLELPYFRTTIRGVPAAIFEDGLRVELYTTDSTIVAFGSDSAQVRRAAEQVVRGPSIVQSLVGSIELSTTSSTSVTALTLPLLPAPVADVRDASVRC